MNEKTYILLFILFISCIDVAFVLSLIHIWHLFPHLCTYHKALQYIHRNSGKEFRIDLVTQDKQIMFLYHFCNCFQIPVSYKHLLIL